MGYYGMIKYNFAGPIFFKTLNYDPKITFCKTVNGL